MGSIYNHNDHRHILCVRVRAHCRGYGYIQRQVHWQIDAAAYIGAYGVRSALVHYICSQSICYLDVI